MRKVLPLCFTAVFLFQIHGKGQLLMGRVLSESGDYASGVTVNFQNKANSISTNRDGSFKIMAAKLPDTLVFSAPGFESYKVIINEKNIKDPHFEVVLLNTRKNMDEVVVTALGVGRSSKELGYSASSVSTPITLRGVRSEDKTEESDGKTHRIAREVYSWSGATPDPISVKYFFKSKDSSGRSGVLAKSRIITAGEVNDFNKWKMWEDYTANEFKGFSNYWQLYSSHRFTVQVTDKKSNAIMNHPVFLLDNKTRDTVWRTYTDNTGKAELWGGFFKDSTKS